MILVTHGIVGAAVALSAVGDIPLAGLLAFLSHFVLDAIPHWDYKINSLEEKENKEEMEIKNGINLYSDIMKVAFDGLLGISVPLIIVFLIGKKYFFIALLGSSLAILPDFLQALYFKTHTPLLHHFMRFHTYIHSRIRLDNRPIFGGVLQLLLVAITVVYMMSI